MRIIVPWAKEFPEVRAALEADGRQAEYVYVGGSPTAYHELFLGLWHEGHGWINVEQDIVTFPGAIAELEACPELWCARAYWLGAVFGAFLGFTKFSDDLVRNNPGVMEAIDRLRDDGTPRHYFGRLDTRLSQVLMDQLGLTIHLHWPAVEHLNPEKKMRGGVNCTECGRSLPWRVIRLEPSQWTCDHDEDDVIPAPVLSAIPSAIQNCVFCGEPLPCQCQN